MAKVFMSFLGATDYSTCNYYFKNLEPVKNIRYVQEATIKIFCNDWNEGDCYYFFLTREARQKNWNDFTWEKKEQISNKIKRVKKKGLKKCLESMNISGKIRTINIPNETSEKTVWEIFEILFAKIKENDEVVIDLTHGFRTSPMLMIVFLNYAKFLKNIKIRHLLYGAFEASKTMDKPIWDLTEFSKLYDWTSATEQFIQYGSGKKLAEITKELKISKIIERLTSALSLNRIDKTLEEGLSIQREIEKVKGIEEFKILPFQFLMDKINDQFRNINRANGILFTYEGFRAQAEMIDFYLKTNQFVQAITLAREAYISKWGFYWGKSQNLKNCSVRKSIEEWLGRLGDSYKCKVHLNAVDTSIGKLWCKITQVRNDIDHAGMSENPSRTNKAINNISKISLDVIRFLKSKNYPKPLSGPSF